jgi:predicted nucleic acid-binding protein
MKVFVDTNVLMDVLLERHPFVTEARRLWHLAERARVTGLVSVLSFSTIHYVVRKARGAEAALRMLRMLRHDFTIVALDEKIVSQALDAKLPDFEDAIRYYSAIRGDAECLLTRNVGHFPKGSLRVYSPEEFLANHSFE